MHQLNEDHIISLNEHRKKTEIAATVAFLQHLFKEQGFSDTSVLNSIASAVFGQYTQSYARKLYQDLEKILRRQADHEAAMGANTHG